MANEIQVMATLSCFNGNFKFPSVGEAKSIDQNNVGGGYPGYIEVGTAGTDIDLSGFTKPGYMQIRNMGTTGTGGESPVITYGPKSGSLVPFGDLNVGEEAVLRLTGTTPTLTIESTHDNTGVQLHILED